VAPDVFLYAVSTPNVVLTDPNVPCPCGIQPTGGGPLQGGNIDFEPLSDRFRLHLYLFSGRFLKDPFHLRFILWSPLGQDRVEWWPGSTYLYHEGVGHFTVDLAPLLAGEWRYRFDSWGPVNTARTGAFVMERVGRDTMRWTEMTKVLAVLPSRPLLRAA
jgi:hypothetical protein